MEIKHFMTVSVEGFNNENKEAELNGIRIASVSDVKNK